MGNIIVGFNACINQGDLGIFAGAQVVVLMVTNQDQADSVLYGPNGAVPGMLIFSQSFGCASGSVVHPCHTHKAC
jgi:3-hydroxyisobutyrate dehydrogenase-like beta-hydroxyacid dehydrogenase